MVGISNGSWMDYNVNVAFTGTYTVSFRAATTQAHAQFQILSGNNVLGTINIPSTGGWDVWSTFSVANISLTAGSQTIRILSTNTESCNFNWMNYVSTNQPPAANAGPAQTITLPTSQVTLTGTGSSPNAGGTVTYAWSQISGPNTAPAVAIVSPASATTNVTGLIQGVYVFRLTVTDNLGGTITSDVTITVNQPPTANAGPAQTITLPASVVTLTGTGTAGNAGTITYAWTKVSGPNTPVIVSPATATTNVTGLIQGVYVFRLTVTNNTGATATNDVTITVNQLPTANAGLPQTIFLPLSQVSLTGTGTAGSGGILTYAWTKISGPNTPVIVSPATASTTITGLVQGIYVFRLTVTENGIATPATNDVTITVNTPGPPTANAGANQTITLPISQVTLTGTGAAGNGGTIAYGWAQISGPNTATIVSPAAASTSVTGLVAGTYVFQLTVTQNDNQTTTSNITITVNPSPPPTANAGANQTITLPASQVTLTGSGTSGSGGALTYGWAQISGPNTATIVSPVAASTSVTGLVLGTYVFRLTVTQSDNQTITSNVTITVNPSPPPTANAGANQTITLPASQVTLTGSGTSGSGGALTYGWSQISGPNTATIVSSATNTTSVTGLILGTYVFRLTVTQSDNQTATNDVTINVNSNPPPTANAGSAQTITLPVAQATLTGSGTAGSGTLIYLWSQTSGPNTATIVSPATASTSVSGLIQGAYLFKLTVTQTDNQVATSTVIITVNTAPVANAGANQTIQLPIATVSLTGSGTDADGTIASYAWTQVSGTAATITSASSATTTITGLTTAGARVFRLTVTDNRGATGTSDVTITVSPANIVPVANAGINQTIQLPVSTVNLSGSATDADGTIASYAWTQISGTAATITSPSSAATTITGLATAGIRMFRLTATDNQGATGTSDITITVNAASGSGGQSNVINVNLYDNNDPYSNTQWNNQLITQTYPYTSGVYKYIDGSNSTIFSIISANQAVADNGAGYATTMCPSAVGRYASYYPSTRTITLKGLDNTKVYTIQLYCSRVTSQGTTRNTINGVNVDIPVTNNFTTIATFPDIVPAANQIVVTQSVLNNYVYLNGFTITEKSSAGNQAPVANAGLYQTITLPTATVSLTGSGTDADGTIASYAWTQISGTAATITSASSASTTITGLSTAGVRVFQLTVTDNQGATGTSDVTVTVNTPGNQAPVANAGANQTITLPAATVSLTGSGTDADGTIASYVWSQISGTVATITTPSLAATTITGLSTVGVRVFRLTVTDNQGATGTSDVTITVNTTNISPVANAGTNQTITLPTATVSLTGSGTDADGTIASYAWSQISGTAATITTPSLAATTITGLSTVGVRVFRLTVTDNLGATGTSDVTITVNTANISPVANAGTNQTITLPTATVSLTGSGTDADGTIASYAWTQVSGTAATITTPSLAATTITGLSTVGVRVFRLTVTDNLGATGTSDVTITVNTTNISPVANAGTNQTITLPTATVSLTGSGTDADGTIASYAWTQVSGTTATITSPSLAATTITGLTTVGARVFRLTVTDNLGATGTSDVIITVNPVAGTFSVITNNPQAIPVSTASLTSTATGNIVSTKWTKFSVPGQTIKKITVIGSSTAAGNGASVIDSAFVYRLKAYYISQGIVTTITNLAVPGQSQWDLTDNNATLLTTALNTNPDVMLMAFPSNAYPYQTFPAIMAKFQELYDSATNRGILMYVSGTQPRNDYSVSDRQKLVTINDSLRLRFPTRFIDFLTPLNNTADNTFKPQYNSGDGIHPNNAGHAALCEIVKAANIFQNTISSASVIVSPANANTSVTGLVNGVHQFQVSVIDNGGFAASAVATVTVNIVNQAPVANAGTTQTIQLPLSTVSLSGSGTDVDGTIASYAWTQISGTAATITASSSATTTITGLTTTGTRVFRLTVTDNQGATATSDVTITVIPANIAPVANAGTNQTITLPAATVSLTGSGTDADGTIASYVWTQVSGTTAIITSPSSAATSITGLTTAGVRVFRLTVTDNQGATGTSDVTVTVNPGSNTPPTANAGTNQTIQLPVSTVTLTGSGTDVDGTIASYAWTQVSGTTATITSPSSASTTITGLTTSGAAIFRLTVTDNQGATGTSDVTITVNPAVVSNGKTIPGRIEAEAWDAKSSYQYQVATTDVGGGFKMVGISTGSSLDYNVTVLSTGLYTVSFRIATPQSGTQFQIKLGTTVLGTITMPSTGGWDIWSTYTITNVALTAGNQTLRILSTGPVNGDFNWMEFATAGNQSPTAVAGANQTITLPVSTVSLTGSGTDVDGTIASYAWTQVSGTTATITSPSLAATTITGLTTAGIRVFRLTVTDNQGATGTSDVTITVNPTPPPTANSGSNQTIILPVSQVSLTGTGTAGNGGVITYAWTQLSGTAATITNASSASTTVTGLTTAGVRVFRLTVTQSDNQTATSDVTITVNNPGPPTAAAGANQTITLPASQVSLTGTGTAGNGGVITYAWTQVSGTAATITNVSSASTTITGLSTVGVRVFRLTVTQSDNQTATSDITITVNNPGPPTAAAGANQTITLPTSQVSLAGSGTAGNGGTITYGWTKISGPNTPTIVSATSASTVVTGLVQGTYVFRLTVTQSDNQTSTSDITITVNPAVVSNGKTIPGRIEAEAWDAKSSYQYQVATTDVGGGFKMVGISTGSSMDYNVTVVTSGIYTVSFRVATSQSGSQFLIKLGNTVLGTANLPSTGGWDIWSTYTISNVALTAGSQTLRILSNGTGNCDFNWMEYTFVSAATAGNQTNLVAGRSATVTDGPALAVTEKPKTISATSDDLSVMTPVATTELFPNPVHDQFVLRLNNDYAGTMKVQVINQAGKIIKEMQATKNKGVYQIPLSANGLPKGLYIINVITGDKSSSIKMIKL